MLLGNQCNLYLFIKISVANSILLPHYVVVENIIAQAYDFNIFMLCFDSERYLMIYKCYYDLT